MLLLGQSFEKDMIVQRERLEKSRVKFDRKNKDLERLKLDYIITVAGTENLEKKNRLELKVNSCEEEL